MSPESPAFRAALARLEAMAKGPIMIISQTYLQLKDGANNHLKHYYIALVREGSRRYVLHTAYGRIGATPTENKKKFSFRGSAADAAAKVRNGKLVKGYTAWPCNHADALIDKPAWWDETWTSLSAQRLKKKTAQARSGNDQQEVPEPNEPRKKKESFKMERKDAPWKF